MQEVSLEELFAQAETIVARLEEPQIALEDAFAAYEQGMQIIRACNARIDQVEKKMLVMNEDGGLDLFDHEDDVNSGAGSGIGGGHINESEES